MIIGGTIFAHKNIHKVTLRSPDKDTMNQLDHVLIQKHHSSNLRDFRCKRVNVDSDLVVAEIHASISTNRIQRGQRVLKYNVQALESKEAQQAFRNKIKELRGRAPADEDQRGIDEQWSICEKVVNPLPALT
jgi:hypothetical protein